MNPKESFLEENLDTFSSISKSRSSEQSKSKSAMVRNRVGQKYNKQLHDTEKDRRKQNEDALKQYMEQFWLNATTIWLLATSRCHSWGTALPMGKEESELHLSIASSMVPGIQMADTIKMWRQYISMGTWKIGEKMRLCVIMMQPNVASSSLIMNQMNWEDVNRAMRIIEVLDHGSTEVKAPVVRAEQGGNRLCGRLALTVREVVRESGKVVSKSAPSFANMSGSSLIFAVNFNGSVMLCTLTSASLPLIKSKMPEGFYSTCDATSVRIYSTHTYISKNSYIRIDAAGVVGFCGKPGSIGILFRALEYSIYSILNSANSTVAFIRTLNVIESC
jgi:hypothetical protein